MIVEKPIDFSTMMADSLSEQTVQVSKNILQEVKEVEIISDLDLVEIATIDINYRDINCLRIEDRIYYVKICA